MLRLIGRIGDGWLPSLEFMHARAASREGNARDRRGRRARPGATRARSAVCSTSAAPSPPVSRGLPAGPARAVGRPAAASSPLDEGVGTFVLAGDDPRATRRSSATRSPPPSASWSPRNAGHPAPSRPAPSGRRRTRRPPPRHRLRRRCRRARRARRRAGRPRLREGPLHLLRGGPPRPRAAAPRQRGGRRGDRVRPRPAARAAGVRSGGHGISGRVTNDGGIVIDLGGLDDIEVLDERSRLVRSAPAPAGARSPPPSAARLGDQLRRLRRRRRRRPRHRGRHRLPRPAHGLTIDHVRARRARARRRLDRARGRRDTPTCSGRCAAPARTSASSPSFDLEATRSATSSSRSLVLDASDTAGFLERWGEVMESAPRELTGFLVLGATGRANPSVIAQLMTSTATTTPTPRSRRCSRSPTSPRCSTTRRCSRRTAGHRPGEAAVHLGRPRARRPLGPVRPPHPGGRQRGRRARHRPRLLLHPAPRRRRRGGRRVRRRPRTPPAPTSSGGDERRARREHLDAPWDACSCRTPTAPTSASRPTPAPSASPTPSPSRPSPGSAGIKRVYDPGNVFNTNFPIPPAVD